MTWSRRWAVDRPGQDNGALTMGPQLLTDALRSGMHFNWPVTKPLHLAGKDYGARVRVTLSARARHSHAAHAREATMATPNAISPRTPTPVAIASTNPATTNTCNALAATRIRGQRM